jgi:hypothetical protein
MTVLVPGARGDVGAAVRAGLAAAGNRCARRAAPPARRVPRRRRGGARRPRRPGVLAGPRKVFLYAHPEGAAEFAAAARKAGVEHVVRPS